MSKEYPKFLKYIILSTSAIVVAQPIAEFFEYIEEKTDNSLIYTSVGILTLTGILSYSIDKMKEDRVKKEQDIEESKRQIRLQLLRPNSTIEDKLK